MSWMDSWSRPSKHALTPPPLYLTVGDTVPYCHTCGRVISERRKSQNATAVKYCSARCRNNKPGPMDRKIEATLAALLNGAAPESCKENAQTDVQPRPKAEEGTAKEKDPFGSKGEKREKKHKKKASKSNKGEPRIIIDCSTVQELVFQREKDPEKVYGRRKNRRARFVVEKPEDGKSVDMVDHPPPSQHNPPTPSPQHQHTYSSDEDSVSDSDSEHKGGIILESAQQAPSDPEFGYGGGKIRPPQAQNDVNGSIGGEKGWAERGEETDEMKAKRRQGQKRADEREAVRKAARRGCAFGLAVEGEEGRRKTEAVRKGVVVEASFAKGEWGIRWRERV
ncbi:hypothetical protein IAQ61_002576 [Plenodomus lingam]|uniref:Uncharacterized protein n=1 Tax=Leptosphaeria maculans (strain JN3 / isolate v23.1.3 / race Av1-4-5-6-7-8) TaxID=985895 RepID=E4ZHX3_LEPMJ|nr:hypothetical protein LEMA_P061500.1 [Plenodomus lingam JN3]KAH9877213.1 hypothetical protein IAQ61_002576 [Plenodomus lingam]CBX91116.1 hypothetical protein LEMA_P061500.1 [Plenodomus lingam JN3]